jgi:Holliday junction resolvase-like predicted endonuclease
MDQRNCRRLTLERRVRIMAPEVIALFVIELIQELALKLQPRRQSGRSRQRAVGDAAEAFALRMLRREHGFRLIEQSLGDEAGELDLVGRVKGFDGVVVVEVRARKEGGMLKPHEAVNHAKQKQVVETARRLLPRRGISEAVRFDVVGVYLNRRDEPIRAEHFPDAFDHGVTRPKRRS